MAIIAKDVRNAFLELIDEAHQAGNDTTDWTLVDGLAVISRPYRLSIPNEEIGTGGDSLGMTAREARDTLRAMTRIIKATR